nr:hypothetical protein CFP56_68562 [Quercus suber]
MYSVKIQIDKCSDIYNLELLMVRTFVSIGACIVLSDKFERMEYMHVSYFYGSMLVVCNQDGKGILFTKTIGFSRISEGLKAFTFGLQFLVPWVLNDQLNLSFPVGNFLNFTLSSGC